MVTITSKQFIIMGLLSESNGFHPYHLEELIEERNMREWTPIGKSSIYRILKELLELEFVQFYEEEVDGRTRKIFSLTPDGIEDFRNKVFDVLSNFLGRYDDERHLFGDEDFYIAFSYIGILEKDTQIKALTSTIDRMEKHILYLKNKLNKSREWPFFVTGLFVHPILILQTDIQFLSMILEKIKQGERYLDVDKWF